MYTNELIDISDITLSFKEKEFVSSEEKREAVRFAEAWENRLKVPHGLSKKEYNVLKKETKAILDDYKVRINEAGHTTITGEFLKLGQDEFIEKKDKINKILDFMSKSTEGGLDIAKAKAYPVEQLLDFGYSNFTQCLWHEDGSPSLHWHKKINKAHCFAGCGSFDSIDVCMKLYGIPFNEAIKKLT